MAGYGSFSWYYDRLTENVNYPARAAYFDKLIKQWVQRPVELLLDLACGTGSLSLELFRLGYDVIGVDGSDEMLSVAIEKKYDNEADIMFLRQDMDKLDLYGTIDVTICALDSINHITDPKVVQKVFDRVSLFTAPGGIFIFDVNTPYKHREILRDNVFVYEFDDLFCCWQNSCEDGINVDISLDIFAKEEGETAWDRYSESFSERAYDHETILRFLEDSGMKLLAVYGEDTLEPPTETTQRAIYVALQPNPR